jgi:hypothetical protein
MEIYTKLSSQANDRSGNYKVASLCLEDKSLISKIAAGLGSGNNKIVIDCAEVLTEVAKEKPAWIASYGESLPVILNNKNNRARWEAMHCLSLIAEHSPNTVRPIIPQLVKIIDHDESLIVRDYAVDTIGNYAKTSKEAAQIAFPILVNAKAVWERRHAKQVLNGLLNVLEVLPENRVKIKEIAEENLTHEKGAVRTTAKKLIRLIEKM